MKELRSLDKKATINVDRFRAFVTTHPALLFPAFQMQLALRQHVLGVRFWERCAQKRIKLVDGRRVTLGKLLEMNVHEDAYLSVLEAHEQVVEEEKQAKMTAYQQSRYANKHPQQAASLSASQKVRAKSIIDWIGLKRQFSSLQENAGHLSSQKYATASRDDPFTENDPRHGAGAASKPAHGKVHPQQQGNANSHLLHPHDEMALLVLQVTGTHHYRRIWTQHHLKGSPSSAVPPSSGASVHTATNSLDHEDGEGSAMRKTRKTHRIAPELSPAAAATPPPTAGPVIGGPASSLPVFVAPPLLSLSSPATAVASADAGNGSDDAGDSSKAANNLSGPPSAQLYQMLLQGDALQRQHKFVELGTDPKAAKKKAQQAANSPTDETDAASSVHASPNNGPRPAMASDSATSTPRKSQVQKTATTLMDLSTATPPPTNSRNRKEILQWQAKVVEQSGILNHVAALQQQSGALTPPPGSARRGSDPLVSHSSHDPPSKRSSNSHQHAHHVHHAHGHHKNGASHGGVRLIGALAGDDVVSPRVAILQHQLHQQHAHLQAQHQQAVLEDYLGPGGSRHGSRRSSLQK